MSDRFGEDRLEDRFNGKWDSLPNNTPLGIVARVLVRLQEGMYDRVAEGVSEGVRCAKGSIVNGLLLSNIDHVLLNLFNTLGAVDG